MQHARDMGLIGKIPWGRKWQVILQEILQVILQEIPTWRIPWTLEPGRLRSIGVAKNRVQLSARMCARACTHTHTHTHTHTPPARPPHTQEIYGASVQFSLVTESCLTLCHPMDCTTPGFPVHHQLPELTQTHVHRVGDAIQSSHPLSSPSPPAFSLSQHQGLFQ